MVARGRKKSKYGKMVTVYLSNESIAKLRKLSGGKQSQYIENLIMEDFARKGIDWDKADKEVQQILGGALNEGNSLFTK